MRPHVQPLFGQPRQCRCGLLCQCSGKIPRPHHIDIVFLAVHRRHPSQIFRPEGIVQIIPHQHPDPVAHGIHLVRAQPAPDSRQQLRLMLRKHLGAEAIADCPVIHIGQKALRCRQRCAVIPDRLQQKGVESVFFIIKMRQFLQKHLRFRGIRQLFCQLAQQRHPHPDHRFRWQSGHQAAVKDLIFLILQRKQLRTDHIHFRHFVTSLLHHCTR